MYPDIEKLINAAKEKGSITTRQREIILAKAQQLNDDIAEVEFMLDDIPVKDLQQNVRQQPSVAPTATVNASSIKYGDVKKCPSCGATVQSTQIRCPECGYEFENIEANSSISKLFEMLNDVDRTSFLGIKSTSQKKSIIQNFPVPNAKADIIEFIIALQSKAKNSKDSLTGSYFIKYEECLNKAKILFPDDPMIQPLFNNYENIKKEVKKPTSISTYIFIFIILALVITIIAILTDN